MIVDCKQLNYILLLIGTMNNVILGINDICTQLLFVVCGNNIRYIDFDPISSSCEKIAKEF